LDSGLGTAWSSAGCVVCSAVVVPSHGATRHVFKAVGVGRRQLALPEAAVQRPYLWGAVWFVHFGELRRKSAFLFLYWFHCCLWGAVCSPGRPDFVINATFDLFCDLGASDEQCDFPVVYASGVNGIAGDEPNALSGANPDTGAAQCAWDAAEQGPRQGGCCLRLPSHVECEPPSCTTRMRIRLHLSRAGSLASTQRGREHSLSACPCWGRR
jgi:hypothetical protein